MTRFAELLHHIWNRGGRTYAPHWMMRMLTEVHSEFKGGNQHDAHDCLIQFLDALHDDLARSQEHHLEP